MTTAYSILTGMPILFEGMAQMQSPSTVPMQPERFAIMEEPTRTDIPMAVRPDPTVLSSDIVNDLLSYESLRSTPEEVIRFSYWLNEKRLGVRFFTKAVEYLIQMRHEDRLSEEEITQIMPAAARRRISY